jgi:hypothetical protein
MVDTCPPGVKPGRTDSPRPPSPTARARADALHVCPDTQVWLTHAEVAALTDLDTADRLARYADHTGLVGAPCWDSARLTDLLGLLAEEGSLP